MIVNSYDLAVVGDHLGGLAAAASSAKRGKRVLLLEQSEQSAEERPMEYLNAICGGPEREGGLKQFFNDLGLSPFGPLGDDRIHFLPLHPPLQVILPGHRINIYQDRVARNWEMEREFGDVQEKLTAIQKKEEAFRERLQRFRAHRPQKHKRYVRRTVGSVSRFLRFRALKQEAEGESFSRFLSTLSLPPGLDDALAGQVYGVARLLPSSLPWYVGMRGLQVLQDGLFQNASGQSGILDGLKEAFHRYGGESRPLVSLEGIDMQRTDAVGLHLAAGGGVQAARVVIDLPMEKSLGYFQPESVRQLERKGLTQTAGEVCYGLLRFKIRRDWVPECMGKYLVLDPSSSGDGTAPTILLAGQPGDPPEDRSTFGMEALGLFPSLKDPRRQREALWARLGKLMPFLDESVAGETAFRSGSFPEYVPQNRAWRHLESFYHTGRRPVSFHTRQLTFLRCEEYVGAGLAEGLLSGIWSTE